MYTYANPGIHKPKTMSGFISINSSDRRQLDQMNSDSPINFSSALLRGLGRGNSLYMPANIAPLESFKAVMQQSFVQRSVSILRHLIGDDPLTEHLPDIVSKAFDFPIQINQLDKQTSVLELFHGPSLSFKDFGARFLAGCLQHLQLEQPITVLTATSGDTGGAVAKAFYGLNNVEVVVVYPHAGVTQQQAIHFVGLGSNVSSVAVDGSFDDCQRLVKQAFADSNLTRRKLISANSINVARLLAQVCYYFELVAQLPDSDFVTVAIPSGNFGNATAAMMGCALGLPIKTVLAVTNENDTVPRYLLDGQWLPKAVVQTITNAIDIAAPNNFSRIEYLQGQQHRLESVFCSLSVSEQATRTAMRELSANGYQADPHTALAWQGLQQWLGVPRSGLGAVVATAHPAKFSDEVESITGLSVALDNNQTSRLNHQPAIKPEYGLLKQRLDVL